MAATEPVLCVTGAERTLAAVADRLAARDPADLHEIRLDLLDGLLDDVRDLVARHGSHLVVACRSVADGGGFHGAEDERRALLAHAAAAGARWVDVEIEALERGARVAPAGRTLASWHGDVRDAGFEGAAARLRAADAGAVKAAVTVRDAADLVRLRSWRAGLPGVAAVVGMGPAGAWTRLRPADFGSAWTYVAAGPGLRTAPGQPTRSQALAGRVRESPGLAPVVLVGGPGVADSPGPAAYNLLFAARGDRLQYLAVPAACWEDALALARAFDVRSLGVTRPFKRDAFRACAWRDPWAARAGVANTVRLAGGRPEACWNTDVTGFLGALADTGRVDGVTALVLGAGDTARALASGVRFAGGCATLACRDPGAAAAACAEAGIDVAIVPWDVRATVAHDLRVQATPLDGRDGDVPWPDTAPPGDARVVDVVLPVAGPTALVARALRDGVPVVDGLAFWVRQGMAQVGRVTGRPVSFATLAGFAAPEDAEDGAPPPPGPVIVVPGSKSLTQRFLLLAALADGPSRLANPSPGQDSTFLADALERLGAGVVPTRGGWCVLPGPLRPPDAPIPCGQGGTTARFLAGLALAWDRPVALALDAPLGGRPMAGLADALAQAGKAVALERTPDGAGLLRVSGPAYAGGRLVVDASVSSQFASALMLAGAALPRGIEVAIRGPAVSSAYLDLTVHALRAFGVAVEPAPDGWRVGPGRPRAADVRIEGDWSLGAFWRVARRIAGPGAAVAGLASDSAQRDRCVDAMLATLDGPGERTLDLEAVPDLLPPLAIAALFRAGATNLVGVGHARFKESDRPLVLASELAKVGARATWADGGLRIVPAPLAGPARLDPRGDHRMAMAFGVLALAVPGVTVADPGCAAKSYPEFARDLVAWRAAGRPGRALVLAGMRGAGKTTVGRLLAARLGRPFVDSDARVEAVLGAPIDDLFRSGRVADFRRCEAEAIREMLDRDVVLATGGGCVEDPDTVAALRDAFTVWLDCPADELARRVASSGRPSVTGAPAGDEVAGLLARRGPAYAACARLRVDTGANDAEAACDAIERAWRALPDPDLR